MKKIYTIAAILAAFSLHAQFTVTVQTTADFKDQDAILYTLNGSRDIIASKDQSKNNTWTFKYPNHYMGMMKVYFPSSNNSFTFISENKNVEIKLETQDNKIKDVIFLDEANILMSTTQDGSQKKELILPALTQIKEYYKDNTDFGKALKTEIDKLSKSTNEIDQTAHPFIYYYKTNNNKFLSKENSKKATQDDLINFLDKSNDMLETSSLLRPILIAYLNIGGNTNVDASVDKLLDRLKVETPRGQTILSELIDIFDMYDMKTFKDKYLSLAKGLKCTITDRLASTIKSNTNVEMGATFPDYKFQSPVNTNAKSLYDIKADKKVVIFWSSTCSHCESELPKLLEKYGDLKAKNVQIIGLSMDTDKNSYTNRITAFPWVNDSELRGWHSSYVDTYNVHATPTYFILDANNKILSKPEHVGNVLEYFKLK
ncbi:TlpA family protein disulfide reductase [Chryseobacterium nematophagum]|uniref:TlpA family protein disulfide reductase n=1 Tax=Chryseobacterium nematophagum TaxID=2305228 RepID=A0A3M7LEG8_9FLAO|nr:TlpA disulfide reductase family protein [Chryseobacterium nematophagum]RMZ60495.1 TlpA family protein disulfide reductase [Chryseobacterium nematophagum]